MSYILDALRRADADRERGAVPGLHSNTAVADPEPAARDRRPLMYAAAGAGAVVVAGVAVLLFGPWHGSPAGAPPDVAGARGPAAAEGGGTRIATALPPAPSLDHPDAAGTMEPARQAPPPPRFENRAAAGAVTRAAERPSPAPAAQADAAALAERAAKGRVGAVVPAARGGNGVGSSVGGGAGTEAGDGARSGAPDAAATHVEHYGPPPGATPGPAPTPAPAQAATAPPAGPAAAAAPIRKFEDLPASLRSTMPRFTVGGAIYSDTPAARMLILNGQLYHEGDHPTPDTLLEQIKLKSAVMNYRGTRYEIAF